MRIGNLDIGSKLILAPMAEVTDSSFRKICRENGAGLTFTQMVSAEGVIRNNFETLRHYSFSRSEKPIGVQILGNDPNILRQAAKEISLQKPDLIDLNCGCPVDKVYSNRMGSALLDDPKKLGNLVRNLVEGANGVPVSVKLRLGKDRNRINVIENARTAEENGASLLFVHARTRTDRYDTVADWSHLSKVKAAVKIPVVGNGSIFTPDDAKRMLNETGCDSAMVARGALGNPFLFSRFQIMMETGNDPGTPDPVIVRETLLRHIKYLEDEFGQVLALDKAKKQSIWYFKSYSKVDLLMEKIFSIKNLDELRVLINEHSEKIPGLPLNQAENREIHQKFQKKVLFWLAEEVDKAFG
jgi:tRNA-dihydrouridine synthase B